MTENKIILIQPGYAHYRKPLFELLNKDYKISYLFTTKIYKYPSFDKGDKIWETLYLDSDKDKFWALKFIKLLYVHNYSIAISSVPTSLRSLIALFVTKIKGKKFIIWTLTWNHKYEHPKRPEIYRRFRQKLYLFVLNKSDAVIVQGYYSKLYHNSLGIDKKKIFVANQSSYDLSKMNNLEYSKVKIRDLQSPIILYFGRIVYRKGLDILIRAFSILKDEINTGSLLIAGDGSFKNYCINLTKKLNLQDVYFLGKINFENAPNYYRISDIFVLPSCLRGQPEGWGLTINEAMSMKMPIITTDVVGASNDLVINGINGYIVKNCDVIQLYKSLIKIYENKNRQKTMSKSSRKIFDIFNSYQKMFQGFKNAIDFVSKI